MKGWEQARRKRNWNQWKGCRWNKEGELAVEAAKDVEEKGEDEMEIKLKWVRLM